MRKSPTSKRDGSKKRGEPSAEDRSPAAGKFYLNFSTSFLPNLNMS